MRQARGGHDAAHRQRSYFRFDLTDTEGCLPSHVAANAEIGSVLCANLIVVIGRMASFMDE
jgi:hypothetical protein